jgi:hypothetical protein
MNLPKLKTYIVAYDLLNEGGDYGPFFHAIQAVEAYARPLESAWIVRSRLPLADLARALSARLDQDDRLLIVECNDHAAWRALMPTTVEWLDNVFIGARKADHRANFRVA